MFRLACGFSVAGFGPAKQTHRLWAGGARIMRPIGPLSKALFC